MPRKHFHFLTIRPRAGTNLYFAYVRVSTDEQKELSLPAQWAAIREYAVRKGLMIAREFEDIESAKEPGRTAFTEMMESLRKDGRIAAVICHKVDRLTRNLKDFALIDDFIQAGMDFHFVTGNFDRSPAGKLGLGIQALFAKHYLDNLSEEVMKGLNQRMRMQGWWAFMPPLAYRFQGVEKEAIIVPDSERFPLLQQGWQLLASGQHSLADIADTRYRVGLRTRGDKRYPGGMKVTKSTLSKFGRIARLDHEIGDHTMERHAVIEALARPTDAGPRG